MPVQFGVQRESLLPVGQQQRQHTDADDGDEDAERAAERGQQDALRQQLTDDPRSRPAPMLSRTAISRLRAAARASNRFAVFAHAIARIRPTIASST